MQNWEEKIINQDLTYANEGDWLGEKPVRTAAQSPLRVPNHFY